MLENDAAEHSIKFLPVDDGASAFSALKSQTSVCRAARADIANILGVHESRVAILDCNLFHIPDEHAMVEAEGPWYYGVSPQFWRISVSDEFYEPVDWIADGSWNAVYSVRRVGDISSHSMALKTWNHWQCSKVKSGELPQAKLQNEAKVLQTLKGVQGIPELIADGTREVLPFIVMDGVLPRGFEISVESCHNSTPIWSTETRARVAKMERPWRMAVTTKLQQICLAMLSHGVCDRDKRWNVHLAEDVEGVYLIDFEFAEIFTVGNADDWYWDLRTFLHQISSHIFQMMEQDDYDYYDIIKCQRESILESPVFQDALAQLGLDTQKVIGEVRQALNENMSLPMSLGIVSSG